MGHAGGSLLKGTAYGVVRPPADPPIAPWVCRGSHHPLRYLLSCFWRRSRRISTSERCRRVMEGIGIPRAACAGMVQRGSSWYCLPRLSPQKLKMLETPEKAPGGEGGGWGRIGVVWGVSREGGMGWGRNGDAGARDVGMQKGGAAGMQELHGGVEMQKELGV